MIKSRRTGFMVKATTASEAGEQFYAVGKDTEAEALGAVRHCVWRNSKLKIDKRFSEEEIAALDLQPNEVRRLNDVKYCREQSTQCVQLMNTAVNETEARALRSLSQSWTRVANQLERYNRLKAKG
jgi:hypothetical protein